MIGAHTDSPCLRVKPVSKKQNEGYLQVGVETYGGGLWHTWLVLDGLSCFVFSKKVSNLRCSSFYRFDRDLGLAGRVFIKLADGQFAQRLVKVDRPMLRIPSLAIHLDRQETFSHNKETQLFPIAGLVTAELNQPANENKEENGHQSGDEGSSPFKEPSQRHHPHLIEIIAKEIDVAPNDILDFELVLYDTQKSCVGGMHEELLFSPRLDNLCMSFCSLEGLLESVSATEALEKERCIRLISLFDHEEIGSTTAQGADSNILPSIIRRLSVLGSDDADSTAYEQSLAASFLISADMAHSIHPNYAAKYENDHKPEMNKGTVIKVNANARYATNSPGIVLLQEVARQAKVPLQMFVVRNDSSCGSTIGPMLSAHLGTRTLDLGNSMLSMHSIRETGGVYDVDHAIRLFRGFFEQYSQLEGKILVD